MTPLRFANIYLSITLAPARLSHILRAACASRFKLIGIRFAFSQLTPRLRCSNAHSFFCGFGSLLTGSAALRLLFLFLGCLSPRGLRHFAHSLRLRSLIYFTLAAGMVCPRVLAHVKRDIFFTACSGHGRALTHMS